MTPEPHTPAPDQVADEALDALRELNELRKECSFAPKLWAETVLRLTDRAVNAITILRAALTAAEGERDNYCVKWGDISMAYSSAIDRAEAAEAQLAAPERVKSEARGDVAGMVEALGAMLEYTADLDPSQGDDETDHPAVILARAALAAWEGR
jgi:hypothetical protein